MQTTFKRLRRAPAARACLFSFLPSQRAKGETLLLLIRIIPKRIRVHTSQNQKRLSRTLRRNYRPFVEIIICLFPSHLSGGKFFRTMDSHKQGRSLFFNGNAKHIPIRSWILNNQYSILNRLSYL